jgi:hypothetical protein
LSKVFKMTKQKKYGYNYIFFHPLKINKLIKILNIKYL